MIIILVAHKAGCGCLSVGFIGKAHMHDEVMDDRYSDSWSDESSGGGEMWSGDWL